MADQEANGSIQGLTASTRLPLNLRRMTVGHICRLVSELGMPTSASSDELRQMIDGKVEELGKDVMNVQFVLVSNETGSEFLLEDEHGKFLTIPAFMRNAEGQGLVPSGPESEGDEIVGDVDLRKELDVMKEENQALQDHISHLEQKLVYEKIHF